MIERIYSGLQRDDVSDRFGQFGLCLLQCDLGMVAVEANQEVAGLHGLGVLGRDFDDDAFGQGLDCDQMSRDKGVVGGDPVPGRVPPIAEIAQAGQQYR